MERQGNFSQGDWQTPDDRDFRDYSEESEPALCFYYAGEPAFAFPGNWPLCSWCDFHHDALSKKFTVLMRTYFRLPCPWQCPDCGLTVNWALRGYSYAPYPHYAFDEETTLEFLLAIDILARGAGR